MTENVWGRKMKIGDYWKSRNGVGGVSLFPFVLVVFSYRVRLLYKTFFLPPLIFNDAKLHGAPLRPRCFLLSFVLNFPFCVFLDGARWKSPRHHMSDILLGSSFFSSWRRQTDRRNKEMFCRTVYRHLFLSGGVRKDEKNFHFLSETKVPKTSSSSFSSFALPKWIFNDRPAAFAAILVLHYVNADGRTTLTFVSFEAHIHHL